MREELLKVPFIAVLVEEIGGGVVVCAWYHIYTENISQMYYKTTNTINVLFY